MNFASSSCVGGRARPRARIGRLHARGHAGTGTCPLLASAITSGQTFYIFGADYETKDGTGVRDYIHLNDLVRAHLLALEGEFSGTFNLGSGSGFSVRELINEFEAASGAKLKVEITKRRAGDPASLVAHSSLAQQQLHWQPKSTLKDMVKSTLAAYAPPNL